MEETSNPVGRARYQEATLAVVFWYLLFLQQVSNLFDKIVWNNFE
jgi:hypothetical protein